MAHADWLLVLNNLDTAGYIRNNKGAVQTACLSIYKVESSLLKRGLLD